ncbi:hypothetical protein WA026_002144 [Henosepilachna vigintioctopunctata]|uniref:Cuticle protein n=1 Tax=Henosepilachna vigintioctopunctata TaxID=420089 RepID=A0AAW1TZJ9_9CUCU
MALKLAAFFAFVAVSSAALLPQPVIPVPAPELPAHYNFQYQVNEPLTGDQKHHEETREGDAVHGSYSLLESDGTRRIVEYTADGVNGFQAVVHKEPASPVAPVAPIAKVVKPVVAVAPAPVHFAPHVVPAPVVAKVAAIPAVRAYHGAYSPYYSGLHPYSGYNQYSAYNPYSAYHPYSGVYSPYNSLNNYYHY